MINREVIEKTLEELENLYESTIERGENPKILVFYSKLAVLELCGWIEESQDIIVLNYSERKLTKDKNKKYIASIVKGNHNFDYYNNFRKILISLIGIVNLENLEDSLEESGSITQFSSLITTLKDTRNDAAHTTIKEILPTYDAPSITKRNFENIYRLLTVIEAELENF